jgi:hypothetical protein
MQAFFHFRIIEVSVYIIGPAWIFSSVNKYYTKAYGKQILKKSKIVFQVTPKLLMFRATTKLFLVVYKNSHAPVHHEKNIARSRKAVQGYDTFRVL